ncbi:MAG: diacylglycerol kinase family protein [Erysipelothrix sp.]|nr:diacylglycerol kinase family protein [Erysipelothrix sp.]
MKLLQDLIAKFRHSFNGLKVLLKEDRSIQGHLIISIVVITVFLYLRISLLDWLIVLNAMTLVIVSEVLNSSIETLSDVVSPHLDEKIRKVKDIAAAAVLIASLYALIVGILLLIKYGGNI